MATKNYEKVRLELDRQKAIYAYWSDAEKQEVIIISLLFGSVIIPQVLNFQFNFKEIRTYILLGELILFVVLVRKKLNKYIQGQKNAKEKIESLKI